MAAPTDRLKQLNDLTPAKRALLLRLMQQQAAASEQAETIPRRPRQDSAPLSFAQQRLWFMDQFAAGESLYNLPAAMRLRGPLRVEALQASLGEVVRRHEALRTIFAVEDQQPCQRIVPPFLPELPVVGLESLAAKEQATDAGRLIGVEVETAFDLALGPLLRAKLLRLGPEDHILVLTMHHIVSDGWSMNVLVREVTSLYEAFATNRPSPLTELAIQYADFSHWQRERLTESFLAKQLDYWKQQLAGPLSMLELPTDRPRPAFQSFRGETQTLRLAESTVSGLRQLSSGEDVTLFMMMLAIFQALLHRYTGQQDITVGVPVAGRDRVELEGLIGFFVNTVVVRTRHTPKQTFRELLSQVREAVLGALGHQDVPFEKLVEELQPARDTSRTPLFQAMFMLQNIPSRVVNELHGLRVEALQIDGRSAKFDVTLSLSDVGTGLTGTLEYNKDLFDAATVEQFSQHFCRLAEAVVENPDQQVSTLPLLTASERRELLEAYNDTAREYPRELTIADLFERRAAENPNAIAVAAGQERLTYDDLDRRAQSLALHLSSLGVGPESLVAVCTDRSADLVTALLAVLKAGGAYVPLDPNYPAERLSLMLEDSRAAVLVTKRELARQLPHCSAAMVYLDEPSWEVEGRDSDNSAATVGGDSTLVPAQSLRPRLQAEQVAYVIYTSGSTGRPKGVAVTHRSLMNFLCSMQQQPGLSEADVLLAVTSLSFDIAGLELYLPLILGATVVLSPAEAAADPARLRQLLAESGATAMQATPATWRLLLNDGWRHDGSLKVLCGGEALPRDLAEQLLAHGGSIWNLYGPTETTIWSTLKQLSTADRLISIGRPIANTQVYILDGHLNPVPVGVSGELYIGGDGLARGYLNQPELTAEKFVPAPFSTAPGARMYRTGDVARFRRSAEIEYLGRSDQQVKVRGYRIELAEVESAISARADVKECAVAVNAGVGGEKQLVAFIVPREAGALSRRELRQALREQLPDYMVPANFVFLEALPLTPNGKLDRRVLSEWQLDQEEREYEPAETPTQEMLANIWAEILKVERVGANDNFFELGGHSLLATQVTSRVRQIFGVELTLRNLFETPTIEGLARCIERLIAAGLAGETSPLVRVARDRPLPISFAQQRMWFIDQLVTGRPLYHLPGAVRVRGQLDAAALELSLTELVRRHESLRTSFAMVGGQPVQVISSEWACPLPVIDLRHTPAAEQDAKVRQLTYEEAQKPFDLSRGPVMRAALLRLSADDHILLFTLHHIAGDGWSMGILVREIATLYQAFAAGDPSPLAELPIQYADFAVWQRESFQGEVLESQLDYWRQQLDNLPALELPVDHSRPAVQTHRGTTQRIVLPRDLSESLKELSRREGVTLFMSLLAAFKTLLFRYSGQEDVVVGTDIANRQRKEVENLIGFFVNQLVLRTNLAGNPTFRELLARVRTVALEAYAHQDLPFDKLVQALDPERDLSRSPLFQAKLVLQNAPREIVDTPNFGDLTMSFMEVDSGTTSFDFLLAMSEGADGLTGLLSYSTDLFDEDTISRFLNRFRVLLEQVVADPEQRLGSLRLISEEEAGGLAPSDFSAADLSQKDFENLVHALGDLANA